MPRLDQPRLRFIPDPTHPGQPENDVEVGPDMPSERDRLRRAMEILRGHTGSPEEVYYCIWDGWGWSPHDAAAPKARVPARSYYLLRGTLSDFDTWTLPDPAFTWPADRAWCVANDVDPHYAGIGGSAAAIADLLDAPGLDVVRADPAAERPAYR